MPSNRPRRIATGLVAAVLMSACGGGDPTPNAAQFCAEVASNQTAIVSPAIDTSLDIGEVVALHQRLEALAPLAVSSEWSVLTDAIETASTVVAGDAASLQRAVDAAYRSESAAVAIAEWVLASCGVDLGPVTTIAPHDRPEPATPVGSD